MLRFIERATNAGHSQRLWPVLAMLVAVVALPTAGVLWFMNEAMQNEQLAVRQRLTDIYNAQLEAAAGRIQAAWRKTISVLPDAEQQKALPELFASLVKAGHVDSILFYSKGRLIYPVPIAITRLSPEPATAPWLQARSLEYAKNSPKEAAVAYSRIAQQSAVARESAMALMAQARCLNKDGQQRKAIDLLTGTLAGSPYRSIADAQGRLILPNALLFALQLMKEPAQPLFQKTAALLVERLNDYGNPVMPTTQRRFLVEQLRSSWPDCPRFPVLEAEETASSFEKTTPHPLAAGRVQPTRMPDLWAYQTPDGSLIALFRQDHLLQSMNVAIAELQPVRGIRYSVFPPGFSSAAFLTTGIGEAFPSWQIALNLEGTPPFQSASKQRIATYVWTGILMTAGIAILFLFMAGYLLRQVRLTRLKNDLIATVSHELKTPLASMRLLVDTLRNGHYQDAQLVQEYLQMIAKENARLSRLIEEFLTFSRMERRKTKFDRSVLATHEILKSALEAVGDRLQAPGCRLDLELAPEMPSIVGDRDALITVLVNLLDNAIKYTGDTKEIRLRGFTSDGNVCFEVQDNGIGFPRTAAKKIFDRFYQADHTLSRSAGGCGLGLSIVQFIVTAHNGNITAKSQPGKGSTFTVQLPAA